MSPRKFISPTNPRHIIIVGSGIAGLIAALRLATKHEVTLVTKNELAESNTRWAQGGIAAAMFPDDNVRDHIADTLAAGAGLCDPAAVRILCEEGPTRIHDLIRLGVAFDRRNGELAKGLEAAHSYPRILHAGGDSTGYSIEMALVRAVRSTPNIHVLEHSFASDLLLTNGAVSGLRIIRNKTLTPALVPSAPAPSALKGTGFSPSINYANNEGALAPEAPHKLTLPADAVLLASGGAGQLYLHTTNPLGATGDGTALALRAGAQLADLEFYQFHPTALAVPASPQPAEPAKPIPGGRPSDTFLISEAVRGEGAVLLDHHARRFMQMLHPAAELAPRDIVARGIAMQMAAQNGEPVLLDATRLEREHGAGFLAQRFPSINAACLARGLDWTRHPIPVTPAAHYWMGGIRTDLDGRTSIPGLSAIGETACTGVHGANRLASNSLLESLVFAWRAADLLLAHPESALAPAHFDATPVHSLKTAPAADLTRRDLQALMWNAAGIERNGAQLTSALNHLSSASPQPHNSQPTTSIADLETRNLHQLGHALISAALAREESRGAHFRDDFPHASPALAHPLLYALPTASHTSAEDNVQLAAAHTAGPLAR